MRARPAATDYRNVSREVASLSPAVFVSSVRATGNRATRYLDLTVQDAGGVRTGPREIEFPDPSRWILGYVGARKTNIHVRSAATFAGSPRRTAPTGLRPSPLACRVSCVVHEPRRQALASGFRNRTPLRVLRAELHCPANEWIRWRTTTLCLLAN
jgi:hypothetical protein